MMHFQETAAGIQQRISLRICTPWNAVANEFQEVGAVNDTKITRGLETWF